MQNLLDRHARTILACLSALFALRILAQWQARVCPDLAPLGFEHYASGLIDYPLLLALQLLILGVMLSGVALLPALRLAARTRRLLRGLAAFYFGVMSVRLALALAPLPAPAWFDLPLPAAFHLVLASYLFICASVADANGEIPCTHRQS